MEFREYFLSILKRAYSDSWQFLQEHIAVEGVIVLSGFIATETAYISIGQAFKWLFVLASCVFLWKLISAPFYINQDKEKTIRSLKKQLPSGLCKQFQELTRQYSEHICDLIDIWPYEKNYNDNKEDADTEKRITQLEGRYKETMEHLETLTDKCGIRRFLLRLGNPKGISSSYGATLEIISWDDAKIWVIRWFDFNEVEDKKKLKDKVRGAANWQEKEYLRKWAPKLTQERYEATNS